MIGTINDQILQTEELAIAVIRYLQKAYAVLLNERYHIDCECNCTWDACQTLEKIAVSRRCFQKGEQPDLLRASQMLMDDFRSGRIGRITLEHPEEWQ